MYFYTLDLKNKTTHKVIGEEFLQKTFWKDNLNQIKDIIKLSYELSELKGEKFKHHIIIMHDTSKDKYAAFLSLKPPRYKAFRILLYKKWIERKRWDRIYALLKNGYYFVYSK